LEKYQSFGSLLQLSPYAESTWLETAWKDKELLVKRLLFYGMCLYLFIYRVSLLNSFGILS